MFQFAMIINIFRMGAVFIVLDIVEMEDLVIKQQENVTMDARCRGLGVSVVVCITFSPT